MSSYGLRAESLDTVTKLKMKVEDIRCPVCRRRVFSLNASAVRLKTRILVFEGNRAYAKCKHCRSDIVVPLVLLELPGEPYLPVWNEKFDGSTNQ